MIEEGEQCDDGNTRAGDGCDASCRVEAVDADGGAGADGGPPRTDGGSPRTDAGGDASVGPGGEMGGCGCRAGTARATHGHLAALLALLALTRRRARR
ncbi:MAG: hypothetical protein M5U28_45130 [Sandaracinaceae bacterium]|nr:hypothetical protein [Sandaracinaceae bacterium]